MNCGTEMKALNKSQSSVSRNDTCICWNHPCIGVGIQYWTSCVELDFLVAVVSHTHTQWRFYTFVSGVAQGVA